MPSEANVEKVRMRKSSFKEEMPSLRVSALAIGNDAGFLDSKLVRRTFDAYASEGKGTDLALALGQADLEQI